MNLSIKYFMAKTFTRIAPALLHINLFFQITPVKMWMDQNSNIPIPIKKKIIFFSNLLNYKVNSVCKMIENLDKKEMEKRFIC